MKKSWIIVGCVGLLVIGSIFLLGAVGNPFRFGGPSFTPRGHLLASEAALRKIVVFRSRISHEQMRDIIMPEGAQIIKALPLIKAVTIRLPDQASERARQAILSHSQVLRIDDDLVMELLPKPDNPGKPDKPGKQPPPQPPQTIPWGVDRIDADLAWSASRGSGVKVAILDTGIDLEHPDLSVKGEINIINPRKSAKDDDGHGTHVAGIVAALDNDIGVIGVAPQASLYAVKVLKKNGGFLSDIIDGLTWCINNRMKVINMSFGSIYDNQSFHDAIIAVHNAGITQVAAAGNESNGVNYPAKYPEVIAVSATDSNDRFASWSNSGREIDFAGPGVSINSTYKGSDYKVLSGTSMSAPHVAGTASLLLAINPSFPPALVGELLSGLSTHQQGKGLIDAAATLGLPSSP